MGTRVEVDLDTYAANVAALHAALPPSGLWSTCAVVKADAYGHGLRDAARAAAAVDGVSHLGVVDNWEIKVLAELGLATRTLRLRPAVEHEMKDVLGTVEESLSSEEAVRALSALAADADKTVDVHLSLESGMGRNGFVFSSSDDVAKLFALVDGLPGLNLVGVMTHFPTADADEPATMARIERFLGAVAPNVVGRPASFLVHYANSATTYRFRERLPALDGVRMMARPGIATYGHPPFDDAAAVAAVPLRGVMRWTAPLVRVGSLPAGSVIGYGSAASVEVETRIGTLGIGYNDAILRSISFAPDAVEPAPHVVIRGIVCPLIGRISMDMVTVDLSPLGDADIATGEQCLLLGDPHIPGNLYAAWAGTIAYEVTIRIGQARNPDVEWVVKGGK